MSYVKSVLAAQETVLHDAKLHWIYWLRAWMSLVFLGFVLIGVFFFVRDVIRLATTEVALTNYRLIEKQGFVSRHTRELQLTSVEAVELDQGFWGRLLGFGRVTVHGAGVDVWTTPFIADPVGFRRHLETALSRVAR